jgi:hypothetical protein
MFNQKYIFVYEIMYSPATPRVDIWKTPQSNDMAYTTAHRIVSCDEMRPFWISWQHSVGLQSKYEFTQWWY